MILGRSKTNDSSDTYIDKYKKNNYKELKGMEYKDSKDGSKGQGSFLLFVLSLWLFIYQALVGNCF